ncbi:MAG: hypothetical protein E6K70_07565 [Planctomycetota bacterium]|nr:MAG: hypothetical protein E6K70_07565 [Planctomycetota bacterium]
MPDCNRPDTSDAIKMLMGIKRSLQELVAQTTELVAESRKVLEELTVCQSTKAIYTGGKQDRVDAGLSVESEAL